MLWEDNPKCCRCGCGDKQSVESIRDVHLYHVGGAEAAIGAPYLVEYALERPAELHGLGWEQRDGVIVDAPEGVVDDDTWSPIALGDYSKGR